MGMKTSVRAIWGAYKSEDKWHENTPLLEHIIFMCVIMCEPCHATTHHRYTAVWGQTACSMSSNSIAPGFLVTGYSRVIADKEVRVHVFGGDKMKGGGVHSPKQSRLAQRGA